MRVGIVGGGIGGLTAGKVLHENKIDFTLFEKEHQIGGHAISEKITLPSGSEFYIDLGVFMYIPKYTHKKIDAWVKKCKLEQQETIIDHYFSNPSYGIPLSSLSSPLNYTHKPSYFSRSFLTDTLANFYTSLQGSYSETFEYSYERTKFAFMAMWIVRSPNFAGMSVAHFSKTYNFSRRFLDNYLLPFICCWWGGTAKEALDSDIQIICDSFQIWTKIPYFIFSRGWQSLPLSIANNFGDKLHLNTPAKKVIKRKNKIVIETEKKSYEFDHLIMAAPPGIAQKLLTHFPSDSTSILDGYEHTTTRVYLHQDESWMPRTGHQPLLSFMQNKRGKYTTFWFGKFHPERPKYYLTWGEGIKKPPKDLLLTQDFYRILPNCIFQERAKRYRSIQGRNQLWYCGAHVFYPKQANEIPSLWHGDAMYSGFKVGAKLAKLCYPEKTYRSLGETTC